MSESTVLTLEKGIDRLAALEKVVIAEFGKSREHFDKGMLALWAIREEKLWLYAVDDDGVRYLDYKAPRFKEDYLRDLAKKAGRSVASIYDHLGTVASWKAIGRDVKELEQVGVVEAHDLQALVKVNGTTGEVQIAPPEVIATLPGEPDDDPLERISRKAEETYIAPAEKLRPADRRSAMRHDTGLEPDIEVFETLNNGLWWSCNNRDGTLIIEDTWTNLPPDMRQYIMKRLKARDCRRTYDYKEEEDSDE